MAVSFSLNLFWTGTNQDRWEFNSLCWIHHSQLYNWVCNITMGTNTDIIRISVTSHEQGHTLATDRCQQYSLVLLSVQLVIHNTRKGSRRLPVAMALLLSLGFISLKNLLNTEQTIFVPNFGTLIFTVDGSGPNFGRTQINCKCLPSLNYGNSWRWQGKAASDYGLKNCIKMLGLLTTVKLRWYRSTVWGNISTSTLVNLQNTFDRVVQWTGDIRTNRRQYTSNYKVLRL